MSWNTWRAKPYAQSKGADPVPRWPLVWANSGKSIAKATGHNFVRMALGGVRDESEIEAHRRTYIGSIPGRLCSP